MTFLLPSEFQKVTLHYAHLIQTYSNPRIRYPAVYEKKTFRRVEAYYPLIEHPIYGVTAMHAVERYNEAGYIHRYNYEWFIMFPKQGVALSHITSWGNDPHDDPGTPDYFKVDTEPHHHHHVPQNRKYRQASYTVRGLADAFAEIERYLIDGLPYSASESKSK